METCFMTLLSIITLATILLIRRTNAKKLPPGPSFFFSHLILLTHSLPGLQSISKHLKSRYGPLITLSIGTHPLVLVSNHSLSHQLLIQKGATFSSRPKTLRLGGIGSASYGPTWRLFRHNLASIFLHPLNVKSHSSARKWVLCDMINHLREQQKVVGTVNVGDGIHLAMLRLSVLMCFGEKLDDGRIHGIARVQDGFLSLVNSLGFNVLLVSRLLAKVFCRNKWKMYEQLRKEQKQQLTLLIEEASRSERDKEQILSYVDTLMKLRVPKEQTTDKFDGGRKLTQKEMVSMCGEFLVVATEATSSALQWIMANLVKHPRIQCKLYDEIVAVVGPAPGPGVEQESVINEEKLQKMAYLKAVVLEGLRRHPPGHMLLPHRVGEEVKLQGYTIPKGATINFMVAEMGLDPEVWNDPMEFKPERFLSYDEASGCVFDVSGSKGIKMMPFGAGRRICPGVDLALLHLEFFVANLVWHFNWSVSDGYHVDLTEQVKFTVVMKNPLQSLISSRTKTINT